MSTTIAKANAAPRLIRVLVVDDMAHLRQDLSTWLQLTGEVEVVGEATNGQEAIAQAEQLRPEVIVMDLEMPVMDGIAATRAIKSQGWTKRIIVLSVHADAQAVERARDAGADVFFDKASHFSRLLSVIVGTH